MIIPPFPPQDLAKLILGYLAEEQLMTAYDEFLQASPYLDAMRNEYDRIFMTSLKNILAEYRAVKIYVETCKPYSLRRRLFGCTNLLEVVKFLIKHVDINKIQDGQASFDSRNITDRSSVCAVCNSLKLDSCVCKSRHSKLALNKSSSLREESTLESSVETTSLRDLPGNHVTTRKKQVRTLPKGDRVTQSAYSSDVNALYSTTDSMSMAHPDPTPIGHTSQVDSDNNATMVPNNDFPMNTIPPPPTQTLDEANNFKTVGHSNTIHRSQNNFGHPATGRISMAGTFQDFSSGVTGNEKVNLVVPDSNTPDNKNLQVLPAKGIEADTSSSVAKSKLNGSKAHIFLTVGTIKGSQTCNTSRANSPLSFAGNLRPKPEKVTILSDIKVDKFNGEPSNIPAVLKNATSTPMMHMQTILINGTTAYKQQPQIVQNRNFTKDEIMAMPTIIVVPTSGPSEVPASVPSETVTSQHVNSATSTTSSTGLGPLLIDVSAQSPVSRKQNTCSTNIPTLIPDTQKENGAGMLVKTVELKNVSLPKDSSDNLNKGTPLVLPPARKSSSTPRRTSHVRVLDFTTPRRILQEAILEHNMENPSIATEVIVSRSPNLHTLANPETENTIDNCEIDKCAGVDKSNSGSSKENDNTVQGVLPKRQNWDADLRALAVANKKEDIPKSCIMPRCRPKPKTVKKSKLSSMEKKDNEKVSVENISNPVKNTKASKNKRKSQEILEEAEAIVEETVNVPVKPTINIISGSDWNHAQETEQKQNKSNNDDQTETPELDRLSLQNAIGAKLNISDLLETPYKQALYDIQMETPRFLGPDLPDEPLSDIKIMNIPTPRFLNTPKPAQATPSSYSSRPTDYSSGGSYYKPDDIDYMRVEDLGYPAAVPKDKETVKVTKEEAPKAKNKRSSTKCNNSQSSRPVRKCAKNVSYYRNHNLNKSNEGDDNLEAASSCSESTSVDNVNDNKSNKEVKRKVGRPRKIKTDRKDSISKNSKTPVKKESTRAFMKIKPRRITPTKESAKKKRSLEGQGTKRTTSKDKNLNVTPVIVSAPTKSRRKSSTPRKIHCTKTFNTESYGNESPETVRKEIVIQESSLSCAHDSDTEQLPLRWSDDGSQDAKSKEPHEDSRVPVGNGACNNNEAEDISKIKEYIASELHNAAANTASNDRGSNLHIDLVKRGFDIETAKIIERDLLDTPPHVKENIVVNVSSELINTKEDEAPLDKTVASDSSANSKSVQDEEDDDGDIELSVSECNEESANFITCHHDDLQDMPNGSLAKLKDKFSMEVCIDDGVAIRLRATPLTIILDEEPKEEERPDYNEKETEMAVNSISNIDKLYTPMKDSIRAQVYEIFDSTLTSLDTPLKANSPKRKECDTTVTEIVLEVEKIEYKSEVKPRKRLHSADSDDAACETKRTKPEAQYLLNSANIQNIDIETVLSKLHGP